MNDIEASRDKNDFANEKTKNGTGSESSSEESVVVIASAHSDNRFANRTKIFCALIVILGAVACAAFIALGITGAKREQDEQFERRASEVVNGIQMSWMAYEVAGLYVHGACRGGITRREFREIYEYLVSTGLEFQVTSCNPNVTNDERPAIEAESQAFYDENYPEINYEGIVGLKHPDSPESLSVQSRPQQPFYFPVHFLEPVMGNENAIDFDLYSSSSRRVAIHQALDSWLPALTPRLSLVQETDPSAFSVVLLHPGVPLSSEPSLMTRDLSSVVVRIPDLLHAATRSQVESASVYIYDSTVPDVSPDFLGGETFHVDRANGDISYQFEPEISLEGLRSAATTRFEEEVIEVASRQWTITVVAAPGTYEVNAPFVILGGVIIFAACCCLALWLYTNMRRQARMQRLKSSAEAEEAAVIVESTTKAAKAERELNDFIAHEVRNPLAAAISACSFVSSAIDDETQPLTEESVRKSLQDDCSIISSSLRFINDLLRNMLDVHRASNKQLQIDTSPTDILRDVFMPVDVMLYRRGEDFDVVVNCPENLVVSTDRLRLKQIILNLGRNASKFVDHGFVRLRASVVNNCVHLYVEDSGPGIPAGKRDMLFNKFQESLDSLNQGTGIGLSLCKNLAELMGAEISYDASYNSGVNGYPGTRFVINLNAPPLKLDDAALDVLKLSRPIPSIEQPTMDGTSITDGTSHTQEMSDVDVEIAKQPSRAKLVLPETMSLLFVDDDLVLRKLFSRAVKRVAPGWTVHEAASGEVALRLVENGESFGIMFVDQYMASAEKQLLGTETVRHLRAKGVTARICGLSANDVEQSFYDAGANAFMFKPFPCEKDALIAKLLRVLYENPGKEPDPS